MKTNRLNAIIISLVLFQLLQSELHAQQKEIMNEVEAINQEMARALIEGNNEKSLSYYTDDVISVPNQSEIMTGIEMIRKANAAMVVMGIKVSRFDLTTVKIITCDSLITEVGYYRIALSIPGKTAEKGETGKYVTIWQRQTDGSLKIKAELWNKLPPDNLHTIF